ncbi:hypothetical protein GCM10027299_21650 [Larkinella ripae]
MPKKQQKQQLEKKPRKPGSGRRVDPDKPRKVRLNTWVDPDVKAIVDKHPKGERAGWVRDAIREKDQRENLAP